MVWQPNHNPKKSCGGGLHYYQLVDKPLSFLVYTFRNRIYEWYIRPIQLMAATKDPSRPHGFLMTLVTCVLIDILCQYSKGELRHRKKDYVDYVKSLDPLFEKKITPPIKGIDFEKSSVEEIKTENIVDLAYAFYHGFRSGIVHGGRILDYGRISGKEEAPQVIQELKWNGIQEVAVNPELLFDCVVKKFNQYIDDLLSDGNEEQKRLFKRKFYFDFGIEINSGGHMR